MFGKATLYKSERRRVLQVRGIRVVAREARRRPVPEASDAPRHSHPAARLA